MKSQDLYKKPLYFFATWLIAISLIAYFFAIKFYFEPLQLVLEHLKINLLVIVGIFFGFAVLSQLYFSRYQKIGSSLVAALLGLVIYNYLLILIMAFVSQSFWGGFISYKVTLKIIWQVDDYVSALPGRSMTVYVGLFLLFVATQYFFYKNKHYISAIILAFYKKLKQITWHWKLLFVSVLCSSILFWLPNHGLDTYMAIRSSGEPITNMLVPIPRLEMDEEMVQIANKSKHYHENYPSNLPIQKKNVILIIVDALRADHLDFYGYQRATTPFLSQEVAEGRFQKVDFPTANGVVSYEGILSILLSKHSINFSYINFSLHDVLKKYGYHTNFILSGNHADYTNIKEMYGPNVDYYFDCLASEQYGCHEDELVLEGLEKVADFEKAGYGYFYFHLMSTHILGERRDSNAIFKPAKLNLQATLFDKMKDEATYTNFYDNGIYQTDKMIAQVLAELSKKGYMEESIVIITGDHGESLGEHGNYGHKQWYLYEENTKVPILIHDSDSTVAYQHMDFAAQVDIGPTVTDRLGLVVPDVWDGMSMYSGEAKQYAIHQSFPSSLVAITIRQDSVFYKNIFDINDSRQQEVYNLTADPKELNNLFGKVDAAIMQGFDSLKQQRFFRKYK